MAIARTPTTITAQIPMSSFFNISQSLLGYEPSVIPWLVPYLGSPVWSKEDRSRFDYCKAAM